MVKAAAQKENPAPGGSIKGDKNESRFMQRVWPAGKLVVEDIASPEPGPGEVVLDVHAAAVNFPDVLIIQNKYQFKPPLPFSPGRGSGRCGVQIGRWRKESENR